MAFCWASSGGPGLGAAVAGPGGGPGYVTKTGFHAIVNDAVPLGGNAYNTNFSGEMYDPLENIAASTDMRWMNWLFRQPGTGNVTCVFHHWAQAAALSYALIYNPWLTSIWLRAFTRPAALGAILAGPINVNCAAYRPFSWGVNTNLASPGYGDTTLIIWDNTPQTVIGPLFSPAGGPYTFPEFPSLAHQLAIFQPEYQRNLIATDELDDGSGRFVGAIDVRNYPILSGIPTGDSLQGPQNWEGYIPPGVPPPVPASFNWWDEVPIAAPAWPNPGDWNQIGVGPGPSHSTFPAAAPPGAPATDVAAVVMYDHRVADPILNFFSIFTTDGNATKAAGVLNRTSQVLTPDEWNIRDPGFGNPWDNPRFNSIAAGFQDANVSPHPQLHLEVVYGPAAAVAGFPHSHVPMTI